MSNAEPESWSPSTLFLAPPGPPPQPQHLTSTQDLLARFRLLPAYNTHVLPYATQFTHDGQPRPAPTRIDKGKAREHDSTNPLDPDINDDGKEKKKKNSYKPLIKGIPGKHSMKKDNYLTQAILAPEKQRMRILQFDHRTQQDAFAVSLEGLKGWNVTTLIVESAQAREDRKKRKELKRLAKAQQVQAAVAMQSVAASSSLTVAEPLPTHNSGVLATPQISSSVSSTPKPIATPRPHPSSAVPRPSSAVPRLSSRPSSTVPPLNNQPQPSFAVSAPTNPNFDSLRGKKREREDGINGVPPPADSTYTNGIILNGNRSQKMNSKAGFANARPRPIKKQRMDGQGQAKDVSAPVQQPTPQGV